MEKTIWDTSGVFGSIRSLGAPFFTSASFHFYLFIYFEQYLARDAHAVQRSRFEWGPDEKKKEKNDTKNNNR